VSKVFIVEDHPVVRKGYIAFLSREPDLQICGEAASGPDALKKIRETSPDLVVLDVSLQGEMNGVDLLKRLHAEFPKLPVLVVSGHDEAIYGDMMKQNGAWGYVMKGNVGLFLESVREVLSYVQARDEDK
jgi:DNA-binding NarL/FixJ family response regulator